MKFSTPQSPDSSTSTSQRRMHRRRISTESSYEETQSSQFQESQTEDVYGDNNREEEQENHDEADDEYEEQSYNVTNNPHMYSETIAEAPESVRSSNTVKEAANSPNTSPIQIPQYNAYINIAPLPMFRGDPGECPVAHLSRFTRVCRANNASSTDMMMRIFPVTLDGEAALWYELNIEPYPSMSWEEIKSSFMKMHRQMEFADQLRSELMVIRQGDGESVNAFYLRMQWILKKWPDHGIPDMMLRGIFIDGLREDYQDWIIPHKPNSLDDAVRLALSWEQAQSIRATRRRNVAAVDKCGFCDGPHDEQTCEIRRRMKELWMRNKDKATISLSNFTPGKNFRSLSATTSIVRRQGEDGKEGEDLGWKKSQCQCWKHQCWMKNARSTSLLARNSTAD